MKKIYYTLILLVAPWLAFAQQPQGDSFTLEQCIEYALANSINAKNAKLDEQIAAAKVKETVGLGLPQISASFAVQHNQKLRRFFTTYNPDGGFVDLSGVPGIQPGDVVAAQNFFQLKSGADAGVTINQLIFSGSYFVGLQASSAFKDYAVKKSAVTEEQLIQDVMKAYYAVLINRERLTLFDANIARLDTLFRNTKVMNENGLAESIDVDRLRVQLNNLLSEKEKAVNYETIVLELLKVQMNYPSTQTLNIVGSIKDLDVAADVAGYREGWDYKNRLDYVAMEASHRLQSLNIKNLYAGMLPTVGAFANMGYATQSPNVGGLFKTNSSIKDQGGVGPDKWYGYSLFGVSLNWTLFTGLSTNYRIQQEKLNLMKIENGFRGLQSAIDLSLKQSSIAYENAQKTLATQKQNMDLAANVAKVTKIKYEQGVGSNLEVTTAEGELKAAQNNYYGALFDAMIAKIDLDKAFGRLKPLTTKN